jgi:hypothetical protein
MVEIQALKSRCLCIPIFPTIALLKEISRGKKLYIYEDIKISKKEVIIDEKTYEAILSFVENSDVHNADYLRRIGDLCRVYAVLGKIDEDVFRLILSLP